MQYAVRWKRYEKSPKPEETGNIDAYLRHKIAKRVKLNKGKQIYIGRFLGYFACATSFW